MVRVVMVGQQRRHDVDESREGREETSSVTGGGVVGQDGSRGGDVGELG